MAVDVDVGAFDAAVFDLDGVVTRTAAVHAAAWEQLFDAFLQRRASRTGEPFRPFDIESDYRRYVDGKPRYNGVRSFLASRGIGLPYGAPDDPPDAETICGLGNRKNQLFRERLAHDGVEVFETSVAFIRRLRAAGLKTAVVTSSKNAAAVLGKADLDDLFDARIDGVEAERLGLNGKPAPDTFAHAVHVLGVTPARALGVEDALAGVEALRAAGFGLVIGVDRTGQHAALLEHGASAVVHDLADLDVASENPGDRGPMAARPAARPVDLPAAPCGEPAWTLVEDGFTLTREHELESLFAIANGYAGSRGSLAEGSVMSAPATFVAGLFEREPGPTPALAVLPDWARLSVSVAGAPLRLDAGRTLEHRRILDLRQAILWREWRYEDSVGRVTKLRELRLASLAEPRLLLQSVALTPENYSGLATIDATLEGVLNRDLGAGVTAALATASRLGAPGACGASHDDPKPPLALSVELGETYRLDRVVAVYTSREDDQPAAAARAHAERAATAGLPALVDSHRDAWLARWRASDIQVEGDPAAQRALRFAVYHLISAAGPDDERVSIGARALTGGAYKGHVFWDTEIFMLPFFTLTWPEAARALLMYRHHTLPAARAKAARLGRRGAFYAWESADTGEDVTPSAVVAPDGEVVRILLAEQEQHISADVAYGVWSYWRATGDEGFLLEAGAEILLETARFWASRAEREGDGHCHIRGVVGPDEYHETVDDDAYTNGMAQWNLEVGEATARLLSERWPERWAALSARLGLSEDELREWRRAARDLYTGFDERTGLFEQFQGYFGLEEIDLAAFEPRRAPIDVLLGRKRIQGSKIIKQPDVLMLIYLLWDRFPPEVREANFRYYEPRCGHGSSLSPAIHALLAARLGNVGLAERYFRQAREIDLADNMGNAAGGVHMAALGGLWQAAVFGFAGLCLGDGEPEHHPNLPPQWRGLSMRFKWRGQDHELRAPAGGAPAGAAPEEVQR
jgi:kojibiose phosphorylase